MEITNHTDPTTANGMAYFFPAGQGLKASTVGTPTPPIIPANNICGVVKNVIGLSIGFLLSQATTKLEGTFLRPLPIRREDI